jgi:hypothetical protein
MIQNIIDLGFIEDFEDIYCNARIFYKEERNWYWKISFLEKEQHMIVSQVSSGLTDIYFKGVINNVEDFSTIIRLLEIK